MEEKVETRFTQPPQLEVCYHFSCRHWTASSSATQIGFLSDWVNLCSVVFSYFMKLRRCWYCCTWVVMSHKCTSRISSAWMSTNSHKTSVFFICKLPSNLHTYEHRQKASFFFTFGTATFMVKFWQSIIQFRSFFIISAHKFKSCIYIF